MAFLGSGVSYFPHRYRPRFRRGIFSDAFDGSMLASKARRASMRRNHAMLDVVDGDPELTSITGARPVRAALSRRIRGAHSPRKIGRAHSELQSLMRISYAIFCLKKKKQHDHSLYP